MAKPADRLSDNVPGEFYVDSTCIDCAACRQLAPASFAEGIDHSYVHRQPETTAETAAALRALVACPTASIGTASKVDARAAAASFPEPIEDEVHLCGYTARDSFGAWSYLIRRPDGNILVDSPRAARPLLDRIGAMGGVARMLLTHRDDVADHERIRRRFGCERTIHEEDVDPETRKVERKLAGREPIALGPDLLAIPVPGHTRGSVCYLYREKFLFTGDHLAWSPGMGRLYAFRDACWHSWPEQLDSMERLLDFRFEWVLPGHGWRFRAASAEAMRSELARCVAWMRDYRAAPA